MPILYRFLVAAVALWSGWGGAAQAEPLRIGCYITWVGNGPFFIAQEKGFFDQEGVEVALINMAMAEAMYAGLLAGQIDVSGGTVDDMLPRFDPEQPYVCVIVIVNPGALTASLLTRTSGPLPSSRVSSSAFSSAPFLSFS